MALFTVLLEVFCPALLCALGEHADGPKEVHQGRLHLRCGRCGRLTPGWHPREALEAPEPEPRVRRWRRARVSA